MLVRLALVALAPMVLAACGSRETTDTAAPVDVCDDLELRLASGTVNGLDAKQSPARFESALPCSTGQRRDQCGAALAFANETVLVRTDRDEIHITRGFKGRTDLPVLGRPIGDLVEGQLGRPRRIMVSAENGSGYVYERSWGSFVLVVRDGETVDAIEIYTKDARYIEPCR
ncbi:MAG TPA: hypothetical protein PK095_23075 [Myxococcota bacterium]|nr:hypothetical protein [Myxococcota bacterium]